MFLKKIEENAKLYPDYTVYSDEIHKEGLTNSRLWEESGRIYSYLKGKNIGRENFVMIRLPRGYDFVTAIVGIWRAGAAVVVLEDTYAKDRVSYIYKDCGCVFEINSGNFEEILSHPYIEGFEKADEHDAAFAVYTSGSTGKPKGVLHEYGNLEKIVSCMYFQDDSFILEKNDQFALIVPFNFIAFYIFLLSTLYFGQNHSWIVSYRTAKNRKLLDSFFLSKKINFTFLTPSYIRGLGTTGPYLNKLLVGSEPAGGIYIDGVKTYNLYAMSESGFAASVFPIDRKYDICPIGRADSFSRLLILDEEGNKAEEGEICFENPYVRGYINLQEETEKAFKNGIFHTNDLGKKAPDGNIVYLGRKDDMIKIDGNRIEPAEIEAVCRKVLNIEDVAVKGFEEEKTIALYYTDNKKIDAASAREKLSSHLPYYMIPAHYCHIDEFPRNSFGKVMRKELKLCIERKEEYIPPQSDIEKKLAKVFETVLGVEKIGIKDDFFELGGNSLQAITLISMLEEENISAEMLFEMRTIENLSKALSLGDRRPACKRKKPNALLYGILRFLGCIISRFIFKREVLRNEIKDVKGPYVVIANHEAALDFLNLIGMTKRRLVPVMSASYYYTLPFQRLCEKLRFIPKQQFQTDIEDCIKMKEVIESGQPLVLYPAGIQPCDGVSTAISPKTWEFLKTLGADVYVARTEGTYFVKPKWSSSYRPGKTTLDVFRLFTKEELKIKSPKEIGEKALSVLETDAYRNQDKNRWRYRKSTVEGLENVLYICPCCKGEYTISLKDPFTLECSLCGFTQTVDEFGMMHNQKDPEKEIRYVSDWSRVIRGELKKRIEEGISVREKVSIHILDYEKHCFREQGRGELLLTNEHLVLEGELSGREFTFKCESDMLKGIPVQPGKFLEIQNGKEIYRCYLDDRRKTVQIADLLTILSQSEDR